VTSLASADAFCTAAATASSVLPAASKARTWRASWAAPRARHLSAITIRVVCRRTSSPLDTRDGVNAQSRPSQPTPRSRNAAVMRAANSGSLGLRVGEAAPRVGG
jgi:hypothetical protein